MAKGTKVKDVDITKSGPMTFRDLQRANQESYTGLSPEFQSFSMNVGANTAPISLYDARAHGEQLVQSSLSGDTTPWGESMFDEPTATEAQFKQLGDVRAENQPWYSQIGAGLAKGAVLAGTTFIDGTIGLIFGAGTAAKEKRWSGLWDNDFSKAMQAVNEWSEQALPNYYTSQEQEQPWYENIFTANFIGDKFIKNLGFTVGAFYSGGIEASALKGGISAIQATSRGAKLFNSAANLAKTIGIVKDASQFPSVITSAVGATISAVNEGRIEALNNSKDWFELHKAQLDDTYKERLDTLRAEYEANAGNEFTEEDGRLIDPAYVKYQESIRREKEAYNAALGKLSEDRLKMGNADLLMNIPILTASNMFQFGKLYANGFKTARKATNIVGKSGQYTAGTTKLGSALAITKGALSEGTEEISQSAASRIAGNYYSTDVNNFYKARIDPEASLETLDWTKSFAEGINETVNDGSAWEEFFIGSLTGALGMPRFRGIKNAQGKFQSPITLEEGAVNQWKDYNEKIARENEIANYINSRINSPEFKNYYQGLIRHNKYQNDMNRAAEEGDEFNFKNAEHAQLVSDIAMFDNAGKLEDLTTLIDASFDTSDENLASIVDNTTTVLEDGSKVGPFVDKKGNPMYATPDGKQEMIEKLQQNHDEITNTIKNYLKIKEELDVRTGQMLSDEQLEELTWMKSQLGDWSKRAIDMSSEVKVTLGKIIGNWDAFLRLNKQIRTAEGQHHTGLTERYIQADKNIRDIETNIAILNAFRNSSNEELAYILSTNPEVVNGIIDEVNNVGDEVLEADEKSSLITKLHDINRLGNASKVFKDKLKEYLNSPEKQAEDHVRIDKQAVKDETNKKINSEKLTLDKAQSVPEFRSIVDSSDIEDVDSIIKSLIDDGNQVAKNYSEVEQYNKELNKAFNKLGESNQVYQDAMTLWQEQLDKAENLEQIANPNSVYLNNENIFLEDSDDDVDIAYNRFQNARYALQRAMSKVNNDIKFKNRFSEEYRKPINEPVSDKGTDKDETGDSGTSTVPYVNPNATPVETPSVPVGNVTAEMVAAENRDANRRVETQRSLDQSQQGQRKYYRPAVPELHIEASKEGDFRPFDVVVAEREPGADFSGIYNYLRDNGAFSYVNAAKIKPGDTLGFMIDPDFNDHTIFLVDTRNNQIVGSIDESDASVARYEGLEEVIKKVRDEFSKRGEEATGKFFATPQTRVSKMMVGRIPYDTENRSLADIPGVLDGDTKPVFGIIKNGALTTNEKVDDRLIIKPVDMAQKEGRLYLLIPNAAGSYSPAAVRVKHFNNQEFNLDDATVANTPIGRGINEALDRLADATSQDDVSVAMKELAQDIYMQDVMVTWFDAKAGSGIVISRKVRKPDGTYEMVNINGQEQIKENKYTIYYQSSKRTIDINGLEYTYEAAKESGVDMSLFGQPREASEIRRDILNTILEFNLPIQVSASRINDSGYNNRVIKSNVLTSNLREAKVIGSWFTTDYFDKQGNLQRSVSPSSVKPAPSRRTTTPVGGTEGVIQGTPVRVGNSTYTVDLKTMVYTDSKGAKYAATTSNANIFAMAWAQENFGDSTESSVMTENKVITPQGRVLDRNTGTYVSDAEAKRIKDKIAGRNQATQNRIAESKRVIADIYENQKRVDKARTDSDYYYILEDDGQYHEYSRVHSRLGDNWLGERTETENSRRALEAGTAVDKVIRNFFTSKETPVKPETLSESAFIDLISKLTEIKSKMEQMGETFMADNIVLFQKYADGTRVAGEVDILSVDKNGNFKIYDVKTSRYSFGDRYFTEKSSKQRMSTKDYYTLQLSAYQNLFESQYGVRPVRLAILPFVLSYDKDKVASITGEKGILIGYNPAVNVPLASAVQAPQQEFLPIFDALVDGTMETENRALPENDFDEHGGAVGVYEKDGKLYTGYLKKIGEVEVTYGSGQKDMVPVHVTKVRDRGFGRAGEFGSTSEYIVVFPNGYAMTVVKRSASDSEAFKLIMDALSAKPEKVLSLSNEKTQIYNPRMLEEIETELRNRQYSETTQPSGAATTIQREDSINNHDEEFEDDLDLGELRRVDDSSRELWNQEKELAWIKRVLPQLSEQDRVRVVKGLIRVANQGAVAWGSYQNGIITLSDVAAEGTTYHEAFHAVFDLLLSEDEKAALLNEAREKWGDLAEQDLKEELAEAFREYMSSREDRSLGRKILDFFKELFAKVTNFKFMKPSMTAYFQMINQGRYSRETLGKSSQGEAEYRKKRVIADTRLNSAIRDSHIRGFVNGTGDSRMTKDGHGYYDTGSEVIEFHFDSDRNVIIDHVSIDERGAKSIKDSIEYEKRLEDSNRESLDSLTKQAIDKAYPNGKWNSISLEEREQFLECKGL